MILIFSRWPEGGRAALVGTVMDPRRVLVPFVSGGEYARSRRCSLEFLREMLADARPEPDGDGSAVPGSDSIAVMDGRRADGFFGEEVDVSGRAEETGPFFINERTRAASMPEARLPRRPDDAVPKSGLLNGSSISPDNDALCLCASGAADVMLGRRADPCTFADTGGLGLRGDALNVNHFMS